MDSVTRQALGILLGVLEVRELQEHNREKENDRTWRCEFETVFMALNDKFATVEEDFISFTDPNTNIELGAQGGHRTDMIKQLVSGDACYIWCVWIKPVGALELNDCIVSWNIGAYHDEIMRGKMASAIRSTFPGLIAHVNLNTPLAFDTFDDEGGSEFGEDDEDEA